MISLQKLFGKDDLFFSLLEASAEEGRNSIHGLNNILAKPWEETSVAAFHQSKEADKRITEQINEALVTSFVTALEKEDIEALSAVLYRIPKTVEKFVERFAISGLLVKGIDFSRHIALLSAATEQVVTLIRTLRGLGSGQVAKAKECNQRLQQIEGDADKLILEILKDLYSGAHDPIKVLALRDLYELLETVVDRCRDAGIVVMHIVLKNS
jgi:uncharacterized protein